MSKETVDLDKEEKKSPNPAVCSLQGTYLKHKGSEKLKIKW